MQIVSVPVLPHVKRFLIAYFNNAEPIVVDADTYLGYLFLGHMARIPYLVPSKYVPANTVLCKFRLSRDFDQYQLDDNNRNILGHVLNAFCREMIGIAGTFESNLTQNEQRAARRIIELFDMGEDYDVNACRHIIARRKKRINSNNARRSEKITRKNFSDRRAKNTE